MHLFRFLQKCRRNSMPEKDLKYSGEFYFGAVFCASRDRTGSMGAECRSIEIGLATATCCVIGWRKSSTLQGLPFLEVFLARPSGRKRRGRVPDLVCASVRAWTVRLAFAEFFRATIKLLFTMAAVVFAGLVTASAGVLAYYPPGPTHSDPAITPQKDVPRPPAAAPAAVSATAPTPPRPGGSTSAPDQGPLFIQAEVVDSQGHGLAGVDVNVVISYPRPLEGSDWIVDRAVSGHDGRIRMEVARERSGGRLAGVAFWAYQPGRAITWVSVSFLRTPLPPMIRLTLEQAVKRTITVVGADDRAIE
jgi:hypothetical protein